MGGWGLAGLLLEKLPQFPGNEMLKQKTGGSGGLAATSVVRSGHA